MALYIHTGPISKNIHTENQNIYLMIYCSMKLSFTFSLHPDQDLAQDYDILDLE